MNQNNKVRVMAEIGVAVALSALLNFIPLWKMPQGGSVSLEMLPIFIIAFRRGVKPGLIAGLVYGFLQLAISPYVIHPVQLILDYPLPYMLVGLAGLVVINKEKPFFSVLMGTLIGGVGRFLAHLVSGAIFFGQYAPEGQNPWIYSAIYNGSFLIPSLILNYIVIMILLNRVIFREDFRGTSENKDG